MRINYLAAMGSGAVSVALNNFPSYQDSDNGGSASALAVTVPLPPSPIANDIFLCFVQSSNQAISIPTNSGAGTWVEVTNSPQGIGTAANAGSVRLAVFWLRYTGVSLGTVTVADSGDHTVAQIETYRGCLTSGNPWNATSGQTQTGTGTTATFPALTTTVGNCLIVGVVANAADSLTTPQMNTASSSFGNLTADVGFSGSASVIANSAFGTTTSTGTGGGFDFFAGRLAAAGSVGTITTVNNDSSANYAEMLIALTSN